MMTLNEDHENYLMPCSIPVQRISAAQPALRYAAYLLDISMMPFSTKFVIRISGRCSRRVI